ncbi:MAG: TlpA family protein disulfide reductase, partial [Thermodesulfobacteriota bacterium]
MCVIFCLSFVYFYVKYQDSKDNLKTPYILTESALNNYIPELILSDINENKLSREELLSGKVMLVYVSPKCVACIHESEFLSHEIERRRDVHFYGVIPFGDEKTTLENAKSKYPFKVYYDKENTGFNKLGIDRIPIKIYLENGVIKKTWGGSSVNEETKQAFRLPSVSMYMRHQSSDSLM